ncbi:hypothetical protein [Halorubrum sp. DM2]|uniref:hypothetical protein n=1 Tax=Halorubrum sp. DM2 TaxID=2527867 RepID=UPI0024B6AC89|nr:hypothetical protein [Halorubrum sp. DM2]
MRPALRYAISIGVGLVVSALTWEFTTTDRLITFSLLPLYGVVTSMILAYKQQWLSISRRNTNWSARKRAAVIGGVGAFTGSLLLQSSVPVGVAGYGLLILGMAGAIAEVERL